MTSTVTDLNALIKRLNDGAEFSEKAAKGVEETTLSHAFETLHDSHVRAVQELKPQISPRDLEVNEGGTLTGQVQRVYTDILARLTDPKEPYLEQLIDQQDETLATLGKAGELVGIAQEMPVGMQDEPRRRPAAGRRPAEDEEPAFPDPERQAVRARAARAAGSTTSRSNPPTTIRSALAGRASSHSARSGPAAAAFSSTMTGRSPRASVTSSSVGTRTPSPRNGKVAPRSGENPCPASSARSASSVISATGPEPSVVRSTVSSWITASRPSAVARRSSSYVSRVTKQYGIVEKASARELAFSPLM